MIAVVVVVASLGFLGYVLFGYPLLLGWWARRRRRPIRKEFAERSVSFLIAVRNGEDWVRAKLESIESLDYPPALMEIIVVSDGSTDRTEDVVRSHQGRVPVKLVSREAGGKAAALSAGLPQAQGEIVVFTDIRQRLQPESLRKLIACFADENVGVVSGDLWILAGKGGSSRDVGLYRRYESWIRDRLSDLDSMFGATGAYYAVRRSLTRAIPADTLLDDMYQPVQVFFQGYRTVIEREAVAEDYPVSLEAEFGRKVRTLAGNYQLIGRFPQLLGPGNRMWIHFLSYKVGRLLLPMALLALGVSTWWLAPPWRTWCGGAQLLGYGLAGLDLMVPETMGIKRITSPLRTFVVMMAAALCASVMVFLPAARLWKPTRIPSPQKRNNEA